MQTGKSTKKSDHMAMQQLLRKTRLNFTHHNFLENTLYLAYNMFMWKNIKYSAASHSYFNKVPNIQKSSKLYSLTLSTFSFFLSLVPFFTIFTFNSLAPEDIYTLCPEAFGVMNKVFSLSHILYSRRSSREKFKSNIVLSNSQGQCQKCFVNETTVHHTSRLPFFPASSK